MKLKGWGFNKKTVKETVHLNQLKKYLTRNKMKKIATILATTLFASSAFAGFVSNQPQNAGNEKYPTHKINTTVADKPLWKDDQQFFLKGKITKQIGKELYLFTDGTGEVAVEIDNDDWDGVDIQQDEEFILKAQADVEKSKPTKLEAIEIFKQQ